MELANIGDIENADFSKYNTCRGPADRKYFTKLINLMVDENADEDEQLDAINDGLWDIFSHQYTLYTGTPLALYLILQLTSKQQRKQNKELQMFINLCCERGNDGIFLTQDEQIKNANGLLPIFSIPEVLEKYA
ncbi:hypothetical protein [Thalassomonas actiniarum]|uniref:Uncharacterized protein n=1 Tax=Thalassomonas actiniarum TaxID=485447 RepID=A0AAE9YWB2_9GAMM|nr:hypothetical protein [Thalassomonas actiniarum]WDE01687.1 hypothetical protein SG35_014280 [Thalassomonas actiniarum]